MYYKEFEVKPLWWEVILPEWEIACIIMREVYAAMGKSRYPNLSSLSRDFPEASWRLLRNPKEFTFQDMAN